jgi:hypothetical protein
MSAWSTAQAADIHSNPIDGTDTYLQNPFTAGQYVDANLTSTGIGRGPGLGGNTAGNRYNARNWSFPSFDDTDYFTWTLTPASGHEIDFFNVSGNWQRSNTGPTAYSLRTSADGFAADVASGAITGASSAAGYSIDLSTLQNITTPIELRLYAWGGSNVSGTFSINDFVFDGAVNPTETTGTTLAGDYNGDNIVDAADYTVWRDNEGQFMSLVNETATLGVVDAADYDEWKGNFGAVGIGAGGGSLNAIAVPEPGVLGLCLVAIGVVSSATRRNTRS